MKRRLPLFTKVLFVAFLNLCLLGLGFVLLARVQFRLDARSFLLAPAQNRIMAVAHALALELDETPPAAWDRVLARSPVIYKGVESELYYSHLGNRHKSHDDR